MRPGRGLFVSGRTIVVGLSLAWFLVFTGPSEASLESLRKQMGRFAHDLKDWLAKENKKAVVIGSFQSLPETASNPGPGLAHLLREELEKAKVPVGLKGDVSIKGILHRIPERGPKINKLKIALEIDDDNNQPLHTENLEVKDKNTLDILLGLNDGVILDQGRFLAGPYGVEILVDGKARAGKMVEGMPFVELKKGDLYTLLLVNNSKREVAAWVGIDGLSMFAFNEEPGSKGRDWRVLVNAGGTLEEKGWFFYSKEGGSKRFLVTDYPQSGAYLKGLSGGLGMITVQFWKVAAEGERGLATGFGPAYTQQWQTQQRVFVGRPATITIRYAKE